MQTLRAMYQLAWADFLERVRRYSFFVLVVLTVLANALLLPARNAGYRTLGFQAIVPVPKHQGFDFSVFAHPWYRGVYNSAWVGASMALTTSVLLVFIGFYLVKNVIERDQRTGVGQIIATTPLSRAAYTIGKGLSNFALLALMVVIGAFLALVMQLVRGEDMRLDLWALFSPFLLITLPMVAVVAAMAVLFECVGWLRGGLGNVIYFFFMCIVTALTVQLSRVLGPASDMLGVSFPMQQMQAALMASYPALHNPGFGIGFTPTAHAPLTFTWAGIAWNATLIIGRVFWVAIALGIALLAALWFTRFDAAREKHSAPKTLPTRIQTLVEPVRSRTILASVRLSNLAERPQSSGLGSLLLSELRLMLQGISLWWYGIALALNLACVLAPLDIARSVCYPLAWIWPLLIWSALGNREARYQTNQFIFSTTRPLLRQFSMHWIAGSLITLLTASGMALRFTLVSDWASLLALLVGALFILSLALAAGVWTDSSRLFEALYLLLWYLGPFNHLPFLDYMGAMNVSLAIHMPLYCLIVALALLCLAWVGRWKQLRI